MLVLLIALISLVASQQYTTFFPVFKQDGTAALLNPLNGSLICSGPLDLPKPSAGCKWVLPTGTRGQTSASFPRNFTYFFAAQQICGGNGATLQPPVIFQVFGPWYDVGHCSLVRTRALAQLTTNTKIHNLNMAWDHTCNLIVLVPSVSTNATTIQTKQISEYDRQVRPQPDYSNKPTRSNCWNKVPGLGALDFGTGHPSWPAGQELNCGDSCVMYTLEQCGTSSLLPRRVIGRYYRSGALKSNLTDSIRIQTLSYVPWYGVNQQFIGVAHCCDPQTQSWCSQDCAQFANRLVLAKFSPKTQSFTVLTEIGQQIDPNTIRVGVEFSPSNQQDRKAYIWHDGALHTFGLQVQNKEIVAAKKESSVKVGASITLWGGPRLSVS